MEEEEGWEGRGVTAAAEEEGQEELGVTMEPAEEVASPPSMLPGLHRLQLTLEQEVDTVNSQEVEEAMEHNQVEAGDMEHLLSQEVALGHLLSQVEVEISKVNCRP